MKAKSTKSISFSTASHHRMNTFRQWCLINNSLRNIVVFKLSFPCSLKGKLLVALLFFAYVFNAGAQTFDAKFNANPASGCSTPHTVFFTDQSVNPDTWLWNFGDGGTSTAKNPIHTFTTTGDFTVKLTVQDTIFGYTDTFTQTVSISVPITDFNGSSLFGCGPLTVNFTDASSISGANTIVGWVWDFGDGSTSTNQNPSHVYDKPGNYTVKLKITDSGGCTHEKTRTNYVQVLGPDVKFSTTSTTLLGGSGTVTFQNQTTPTSPIINWSWNFGDGSTSNLENPTHTYTTSGTFDVSLTVTDLDGCSRTLIKTNYVNTISGAFDISKAIFEGNEDRFSVAAQESEPRSMAFNLDGTKLYVMGSSGDDINEYNLSVAYDVTSAVYAGDAERFSVAAEETAPRSFAFNNDGSKMFVIGTIGDDVNEYNLSTAFDVSTAVFAGNAERFSVAAQETNPTSLTFNHDGIKMYVAGSDNDAVNEYILSKAFDVSSATYSKRLLVGTQELFPQSIVFVNNGLNLLVMGSSGDDINQYTLTTAFDLSTATFAGNAARFSVASQDGQPNSVTFSPDGTKMFVLGVEGSDINVYSLAAPVIAGAVANQAVNDNATISPFSAITVADPNGDNLSATITLDDNAKGVLSGTGLTGSGPYTLASTDAASLQASLRALVFNPTDNRVGSGSTEKTTFTLEVSDSERNDTDANTTVISSPVAPTVSLSSLATSPTNGFGITITFSEAVTGFAIGDITVGNGTASNFNAISTSVYTADITPTTDGTVTVDVAANVAQDAGGVDNAAATQFSITADLTSPTVLISSTVADPTNGAFTATFTFSEAVTGFTIGDITVGNGTTSNFTSTSASVYTALITPTTDGTVTIDVAANVAQDAATNGNTAASQFSITADLTSPTVVITSAAADPINGAFTATFTFSEAVTGFAVGDITVGSGAASNFVSTSTTVYTALITPTTDGAVTVDVAANVAQDAAINGNTAATQFSITADLTSPTVLISSTAANPINGAFTATFTFSEAVTGFAVGDITVGNGAASNFVSTSTTVYTALITPTTDGAVTVDVAANVAEDAATNGNTAATQFSVEADLTAPTITISSTVADPTNGAFTATFTFSEDVTGFAIGDITVANGTASNFTATSTSVYTALITPTTDGAVTVDVAANVAQDAATNGNTAATQFSLIADLTSPTVVITSAAADPINGAFTATFTFSEAVTGFAIGDITVANGTASNFASTSASVYTALITPTTDGAVTIDVAGNIAQDDATNGNTAATQFSLIADLTSPTVAITSTAADPINGAFTATFTFSEAVTGFAVGDITLGNATASNFTATSTSVYTALITPTTDGTLTIDVVANVAEDAATNGNTAATQFSLTADLTAPTVLISSMAADPINGAFTTTFTFSEAVTGFALGDITVGNGAASNFVSTSTTVYTALITPTTDGAVTIDVAGNVAQDAATNGNTAASQFSITADLTSPTVVITSAATDPINGAFTTTFTFSEAVTGFAVGDISVSNGAASNFVSTSTTVYTALITPTTDGAVTVNVAANVAQDAATNGNTAATQFSLIADLTSPTVVITSAATDPTNGVFTTTFTFSEAVTGFAIGDITVANGTASNFTSINPSVYTTSISPLTDGVVTVDVPENIAEDVARNGNVAATQFSIIADLTAPEISMSGIPVELNNFEPFTITYSFSEKVTGFAGADFQLVNAELVDFSTTDNVNYNVSFKAKSNQEVRLILPANTVYDLATNANTTETVVDISFNSLPMDISLSALSIDENNSLAAEIGQFTTADADVGDVQTYSLVAGVGSEDNDKFSITFNKLRAASIFDFEAKSVYNIRIKTDDGKGGVFEKAFVISINDLNEQPTNISLSNTLIDESDETDILVGLFTTEDQDNGDSFTYELVTGNRDDNNDFFKIVNDELHTSQAINFEAHELLSIRVRVIDSGGLTFEKPFEIVINNVVNEEIRDYTKDSPTARIKNFFTPNGDGVNDVWVIEDILDNPDNEVKVFAQNGKLVFRAKSYQNNWDGKFEGQLLPSGTYFYEVNVSNGKAIIRGMLLILTK
ncbi:Ig-like domain-containing protein [Roseivirga seohaensis]|uniref:Ig-like domain-containing protein n=1 Tax=Roseivirga seohaensis TaxID=1914963 RepID=UPI003BAD515B